MNNEAIKYVDVHHQINRRDVLVSFQNVKISFKHGIYERTIIKDLNLDIYKGEILGLVGESGSGKTTIGRGLIRIIPISGGKILYGDNKEVISGKIGKEKERNLKIKVIGVSTFSEAVDKLNRINA